MRWGGSSSKPGHIQRLLLLPAHPRAGFGGTGGLFICKRPIPHPGAEHRLQIAAKTLENGNEKGKIQLRALNHSPARANTMLPALSAVLAFPRRRLFSRKSLFSCKSRHAKSLSLTGA